MFPLIKHVHLFIIMFLYLPHLPQFLTLLSVGNFSNTPVSSAKTNIDLPEPLVIVNNLPLFARATVTKKKGMAMVHLLSYCPEQCGAFQVIEEPIFLKKSF